MFNGYENEELVADHIKALLVELEGAERIGDKALAAKCRASLAAFGHKAAAPRERAEKRPSAAAPKRETRRRK